MIPEIRTPIHPSEVVAAFANSLNDGEGALRSFEKSFAEYIGVRHAICVHSGRDALYIILKILRLGHGSKVVVPAYTSPIVPMVVLHCGFAPVYADVDTASLNITTTGFSEVKDKDTKIVIPIHMFGNPCDIDSLVDAASDSDVVVIEDAAQALGAKYRGRKVGSFGDVGFFSFGRGKNITTLGGGMIVTNQEDLAKKIKAVVPRHLGGQFNSCLAMAQTFLYSTATSPILYNFGCRLWNLARNIYSFDDKDYLKKYTGYQAAVGKTLLKQADFLNGKRIKNATVIKEAIENIKCLTVQETRGGAQHVYLRFIVRHLGTRVSRDSLEKKFFKYGFDTPTMEGYCPLNYFPHMRYSKNSHALLTKVKNEIADRTLALPTNPDLSEENLQAMVQILKNQVD